MILTMLRMGRPALPVLRWMGILTGPARPLDSHLCLSVTLNPIQASSIPLDDLEFCKGTEISQVTF